MRIGIDLMGGDTDPVSLYQGVLEAYQALDKKFDPVLFASREVIQKIETSFEAVETLEEVKMDESPLLVVRRKHSSSMALGIKALKNDRIDAFVSAGNTGAITAFSALELNRLLHIDRPALLALLPSQNGEVAILDVGANIAFRPKQFLQMALMGASYQKFNHGIKIPKVGLLNIGAEARKGTQKIREAFDYLKEYCKNAQMEFVGNIEGRDVFDGAVDVVVTDGFTGNVFLKTCEGVASFVLSHMSGEKSASSLFKKYLDYSEYPGAVLLGVDKIVVKCHGYSTPRAMKSAINGAFSLVKSSLISHIKDYFKKVPCCDLPNDQRETF